MKLNRLIEARTHDSLLLYHFTLPENLPEILESGKLIDRKRRGWISFTRRSDLRVREEAVVRLTFGAFCLTSKHKVTPYSDFWNEKDLESGEYLHEPDMLRTEAEEIIRKSSIELMPCLKSIDIYSKIGKTI